MFWYLLLFQWFIFLISYFSDDQLAYGELQTSPKCQCFKPKNIYLLFILHVQCSYSKIRDKAAVTHTHFHYFTAKTREIRPSIHMWGPEERGLLGLTLVSVGSEATYKYPYFSAIAILYPFPEVNLIPWLCHLGSPESSSANKIEHYLTEAISVLSISLKDI